MTARLVPTGLLAPWLSGFREELERWRYAPLTIREWVWVMARFDSWLDSVGVQLDGLTVARLEQFLAVRREQGADSFITVRGMEPLMGFLRRAGVVPEAPERVPSTPSEVLVARFKRFLTDERGLKPRSVMQCGLVADKLLVSLGDDPVDALDAVRLRVFVAAQTEGWAPNGVKHLVWSLRSFLKFLFLEGIIDRPLADAVPPVKRFSGAGLPEVVPAAVSMALVNSCDVSTVIGLRDRAVLMLLSRLGLRAGEVTRLRLDDIDWRAGEIVVAGKGGRVDRLPLPVDVGEALVEYLRHARPDVAHRQIFVGAHAPHRALSPTGTMNHIVAGASARAGLERFRPHQLRHGAASQMLAAGGSLAEIGQVLRHANESTTALYAKVDVQRLMVVVRPWPTVTR